MKKFLKISGIICLEVLIWIVVIGGMLFLFSKRAKRNIAEMTKDMEVNTEEGKKKYTYICSETEERVYSKKKNIDLIELVHNEITGSKFRMVNSIKENVSFTCGIIDKKYLEENQNVYNLKIEGKKPDEIIEFESLERGFEKISVNNKCTQKVFYDKI